MGVCGQNVHHLADGKTCDLGCASMRRLTVFWVVAMGIGKQGCAREVVQEGIEQLRLGQQDQSRRVKNQHMRQCTTNV